MRQVGESISVAKRFLWIIAALVFGAALVSGLASGVPIFGPRSIERPADGFAIQFPRDWEYADATVYDADWWDASHGPPAQQHEEFLDRGGVLRARKRAKTEAGHQQCSLHVMSSAEAQQHVNAVDDDPRAVAVDTRRLELPGGSAIACDVLHKDGWDWRDYLVTDGRRWLWLECGSANPPEDRWLAIAETIEILPAG